MAYIWSWLLALVCPLLMGLMLWLLRRTGDYESSSTQTLGVRSPNTQDTAPPERSAYLTKTAAHLSHCINWKVGIGVAIVCLGIWRLVPSMLDVIPLLIASVCPLSMLLILCDRRSEQRGDFSAPVTRVMTHRDRLAEIVQEQTLRRKAATKL